MRTDDKLRLVLRNGDVLHADLRVYRIPSMYHPNDPEKDTLGLYIEAVGKSRCVTVNRRHSTWVGTYDAIVRFVSVFCEGRLGHDLRSFEVVA